MEVLTSLDMKCGKCIVFVTVVAALAASATAFDGYKLDDMGNPISLNAEAPRAKPSLQGPGMERFREAAAPAIKADPHIAKLVKEKTEIAIKLAAFEPTPEAAKEGISAQELEQLNAFREKVENCNTHRKEQSFSARWRNDYRRIHTKMWIRF